MQEFSQYIKESDNAVPDDVRSNTVFVYDGPDGQVVIPSSDLAYTYWIKDNHKRRFKGRTDAGFILILPSQTRYEMYFNPIDVYNPLGIYNSQGMKVSIGQLTKVRSLVEIAFRFWLHHNKPEISQLTLVAEKFKIDLTDPSIINFAKGSLELALHIVHSVGHPIPELEPILAKQSASAFLYAKLTGKKFPLGEPAINKVDRYSQQYSKMFEQLDESWNNLSVLPNLVKQLIVHYHKFAASTDTVVQLKPSDDPVEVWKQLYTEVGDNTVPIKPMAIWYNPIDLNKCMLLDKDYWSTGVYNSELKLIGVFSDVFGISKNAFLPFSYLNHDSDEVDSNKGYITKYTKFLFDLGYKCWLIVPTRTNIIRTRDKNRHSRNEDPLNWRGNGSSMSVDRAKISLRGRSLALVDKVADKMGRDVGVGRLSDATSLLKKISDTANIKTYNIFDKHDTHITFKDYMAKVKLLNSLSKKI